MSFSLKHLLLATTLLAIAVVSIRYAVYACRYGIDEAYAEQYAARVVVSYLRDHNEQWPSGWNDLRTNYMQIFEGTDEGFEEIRHSVRIEFNVTTDELWKQAQAHDRPVFDVIQGVHKTGVLMGAGPNWTLYEYLRSIECP